MALKDLAVIGLPKVHERLTAKRDEILARIDADLATMQAKAADDGGYSVDLTERVERAIAMRDEAAGYLDEMIAAAEGAGL